MQYELLCISGIVLACSAIVNFYQYATVCDLQDDLDTAETRADMLADQLTESRRDYACAKLEADQQRNRADILSPKRRMTDNDHILAAVRDGHTGMLEEAKARVLEQRRLDKSKHIVRPVEDSGVRILSATGRIEIKPYTGPSECVGTLVRPNEVDAYQHISAQIVDHSPNNSIITK